jgi:DNA phosphorothioation-dependent restriction protein DptG
MSAGPRKERKELDPLLAELVSCDLSFVLRIPSSMLKWFRVVVPLSGQAAESATGHATLPFPET